MTEHVSNPLDFNLFLQSEVVFGVSVVCFTTHIMIYIVYARLLYVCTFSFTTKITVFTIFVAFGTVRAAWCSLMQLLGVSRSSPNCFSSFLATLLARDVSVARLWAGPTLVQTEKLQQLLDRLPWRLPWWGWHLWFKWNVSPSIGWIVMTFSSDIHTPLRVNCNNSVITQNPVTFREVPSGKIIIDVSKPCKISHVHWLIKIQR